MKTGQDKDLRPPADAVQAVRQLLHSITAMTKTEPRHKQLTNVDAYLMQAWQRKAEHPDHFVFMDDALGRPRE